MPNWTGLVMTRKGKRLQTKAIAGATLQFTRLKLGDGQLSEGQHVETLTDLISPKQVLNISECKVTENDLCEISSVSSNSGLANPYYARELGVFANDPDEGEVLYAVCRDDLPDYIPEDGGSVPISHNYRIYINVGNIKDVTGQIDIGGWATSGFVVEQIGTHDKDPQAHYDMTGSTTKASGKRGFVPAPSAGSNGRFLCANGNWETPPDTQYNIMAGASKNAAGKEGLVPPPKAGDNGKYLRGDGKWEDPSFPDIMKGASQYSSGEQGLAPKPIAGDQEKFLKGDGTWGNEPVMEGASKSADGQAGLAPKPVAGDDEKFLKGDGKWSSVPTPPDMAGATATAAGKKGMVPAPSAGDQINFLCGNGQWKSIIDLLFPVGRIIMSMDSTNPGSLYPGTTWQRIGSGRTIIDCGGDYKAGTPGGAATVTLTAKQMPAHNHSGSTASAGAHTHTRGTMEITGSLLVRNNRNSGYAAGPGPTGAFEEVEGRYRSEGNRDDNTSDKVYKFTASKAWTGATSSAGAHTHGVTINNSGNGEAHNNMPPYMPAYIWQRIA